MANIIRLGSLLSGGSSTIYAILDVYAVTGSTVTVTYPNGTVVTGTEGLTGEWVFNVPEDGVYTATAINGESESSQDVTVSGASVYEVNLTELSFTYTGTYTTRSDGVILLKSSGTLTFAQNAKIDLFLVGGGGGGGTGQYSSSVSRSGGGGGGGYTKTVSNYIVNSGENIPVTIGAGGASAAAGGKTTIFTFTASGGYSPGGSANGGNGGSGGGASNKSGGSDGGNGGSGLGTSGGTGQGTTTREFGESTGIIYAGGGGGGATSSSPGGGGSGGGGQGGVGGTGNVGTANTGGGGGGGGLPSSKTTVAGGAGGSGIICIRKHVS